MNELSQSRITLGIHAFAAIAIGWLSSHVDIMIAAVAGIAVLVACKFISERMTQRKGLKWWASNGVFVYLMFWLITWTVMFNAA
jgi:hypothetical protein